jgi:hypothetical protein
MTPTLLKATSQEYRVLQRLLDANGAWLHGDATFGQTMRLRQWHRAINVLENKYHRKIEHSPFTDEHKFRSYRIVQQVRTLAML